MTYPLDFTRAVEAEFPDFVGLLEALHSGDIFLGRYLCDNRDHSRLVVKLLLEGRTEEALAVARRDQRISNLYRDWCLLADAAFQKEASR